MSIKKRASTPIPTLGGTNQHPVKTITTASNVGTVVPSILHSKMNPSLIKQLGLEWSEEVGARNIKLLIYGDPATWKTETVLRKFPKVLLIDTEGNSDQCVGQPDIPPFLRVKTKDPSRILQVLEMCSTGKVFMPDGSPIQTVCIDSISVLWGIQQDVAAGIAEQRAQRFGGDIATANATTGDWGKAKRPLKRIMNRFSNSEIPFLVIIARTKPLYDDTKKGDDQKKIGVQPDMVRGTDFDMNVILKFTFDKPTKQWGYEVDKVQGGLKSIFPLGGSGREFPITALLEYARNLKTKPTTPDEDEERLAATQAAEILSDTTERTSKGLAAWALREFNLQASEVGATLKAAGFTGFDPSRWDEMKEAIAAATQAVDA